MYRVIMDPEAAEQIAALPVSALPELARIYDVLEVAPWSGPSQNVNNPTGAVRHWLFGPDGAGDLVYLVLEREREVHLLQVTWFGPVQDE